MCNKNVKILVIACLQKNNYAVAYHIILSPCKQSSEKGQLALYALHGNLRSGELLVVLGIFIGINKEGIPH